MKINFLLFLLIVAPFFPTGELFNIETMCTGTQGSYTFEISATFGKNQICVPGYTENSNNCEQPKDFVELEDESPIKGTAAEALTCYFLVDLGSPQKTIRERAIIPPHEKNYYFSSSMWEATKTVEFSPDNGDWYFQINGNEVPSKETKTMFGYTYTVDAGPQILDHPLYALKDFCSGTAKLNVSDRLIKKGIRIRNQEAHFCDDKTKILEGMAYQAYNEFKEFEPKELSQCSMPLPESTKCFKGGLKLLDNGKELANFRIEYFSMSVEQPDKLFCPGYVYDQDMEITVRPSNIQYSVIQFCSYPKGNPEKKRCTDQFEEISSVEYKQVYSVNIEMEVNEDFQMDLEMEVQGEGHSSCQETTMKKTTLSFPLPQANPEINLVPIDNEKQLALVSTSLPTEIVVKKDQETVAHVEEGNIAVAVIHQNDSRIWAQAHSKFCDRRINWETTVQSETGSSVSLEYLNEEPKLFWNIRRLGSQTIDFLLQGTTPQIPDHDRRNMWLKTDTEYMLEYSNGDKNYTVSFHTNPPQVSPPEFRLSRSEPSCNLTVRFDRVPGCKYGPSEDNLGSSSTYEVQSYGPEETTTPIMDCRGTIYRWEYLTPAKSSYDPDQMELKFNKIPGRCEVILSIENVEYNPWETLTVGGFFDQGKFDHNLNAVMSMRTFSRFSESVTITKRSCDIIRPTAIKDFPIPDNFFPEWINQDIPASYEWNGSCSELQLTVNWNNEFYSGDPYFVVLELDIDNNLNETMMLTEYAEKGNVSINFFSQQLSSKIQYRMDIRNCSGIANIQWPWQQLEIEECDAPEPGESIPEDIPQPPPPITRERPVSRPIRRIWGDPHLQTIDGNTYSFNGVGEYVLLRSKNNSNGEPFFNVQVSLTSTKQGSFKGSTISGVALQLDETVVEYNTEKEIYVNGKLDHNVTMNSTFSIPGSPLTISRYIDEDGNNVIDMEVLESADVQAYQTFLFRCILSGGTISFAYSLPDYVFKNSEGLGGCWDGDDTNDFQMSNGTVFQANTTELEAFHFGLSWALSKIPDQPSSLFHSPSLEDPDSYTPDFIEELDTKDISQDKKDACAQYSDPIENKRCLFDVEATNNLEMANIGKQMEKIEEETKKEQVKVPQSLEGIFANNITETSAFISWNNLRAKYRVAPYYAESIEINIEPFDNANAPLVRQTMQFDIDGARVDLVSGTDYLLTAKLINEVGTSSSTPIRHFTTASPTLDSSSSSSSNSSSSSDSMHSMSSISSESISSSSSTTSDVSSSSSSNRNDDDSSSSSNKNDKSSSSSSSSSESHVVSSSSLSSSKSNIEESSSSSSTDPNTHVSSSSSSISMTSSSSSSSSDSNADISSSSESSSSREEVLSSSSSSSWNTTSSESNDDSESDDSSEDSLSGASSQEPVTPLFIFVLSIAFLGFVN